MQGSKGNELSLVDIWDPARDRLQICTDDEAIGISSHFGLFELIEKKHLKDFKYYKQQNRWTGLNYITRS